MSFFTYPNGFSTFLEQIVDNDENPLSRPLFIFMKALHNETGEENDSVGFLMKRPWIALNEQQTQQMEHQADPKGDFDYSFVSSPARIAIYDDMLSAPRVIEIAPAPTTEFIESLASNIYTFASQLGGSIPYSAIREVSENFIHAKFSEIVVSVLDKGNTIRFADQGPGIQNKEKAQLPGFTSAVEPMKRYIRGVGSGLPLVREYLQFSNGKITIEDNLESGAVVTLSLTERSNAPSEPKPANPMQTLLPPLNQREREFLSLFAREGVLGVTDLRNITGMPNSTIYNTITRLEEAGLLDKVNGKKRTLSDFGEKVSHSLL